MTQEHRAKEMIVQLKDGSDPIQKFNINHGDGVSCKVELLGRAVELMVDQNGYFSLKVKGKTGQFKTINSGNVGFHGFVFGEYKTEEDKNNWDTNFRPQNRKGLPKSKEFICPHCNISFILKGKKLRSSEHSRKTGSYGPFCTMSCASKWKIQQRRKDETKITFASDEEKKTNPKAFEQIKFALHGGKEDGKQ